MEMSTMSARGIKVKLARKGRPSEAGRKPASALGRRPARDAKAKVPPTRPVPANDTLPPSAEAMGLPPGDPSVDEIEVEGALGATPGVEIVTDETDEVVGDVPVVEAASEEDAPDSDEDEDEDEDEEDAVQTGGDPVGDADVLSDLGTPARKLLDLSAAEGQLPADIISALCERAGCLEALDTLRLA
jgi:hypothetical protein